MMVGGLWFLKQTQSVKGYYLMGYLGIGAMTYFLSKGLKTREDIGFSGGLLFVFSAFLLYGLTTLTENLSTKGYYFAVFMLIFSGSFIYSNSIAEKTLSQRRTVGRKNERYDEV